jgi:hypothetical protein
LSRVTAQLKELTPAHRRLIALSAGNGWALKSWARLLAVRGFYHLNRHAIASTILPAACSPASAVAENLDDRTLQLLLRRLSSPAAIKGC